MFSYRHSFHAGNHADVLKHLTQLCILKKLTAKNKPAVYIDTHAGAGVYDLDSPEALKTQEFTSGIGKLNEQSGYGPLLATYQQLVEPFWQQHQYPGSPMIARQALREQDSIILMEYHNNEVENLKYNMSGKGVQIHHRDGFEGLIALCPPNPKRGLVLIDPPYEDLFEYQQLYDCLVKSIKKWPVGIFAIWYPLLSARAGKKSGRSEDLLHKLAGLEVKNVLNVSMQVCANDDDAGMFGSGMVIINAPWQLDVDMQQACAELKSLFKDSEYPLVTVEWLKQGD